MLRLARHDAGLGAELLGEDRREDRRHVLHDEDRHALQGKAEAGDDLGDRARSARGGADEQAARRHRHRPRPGDRRRADRRRRPGLHAGLAMARGRKPLQLGDQLAAEPGRGRHLAARFRLRQAVDRAELEAFQGDVGVALGQGRDDDDRHLRTLAQQMRQRADAVELRHVEIEQDDIGLRAVDEVDRHPAVDGRADHLELAGFVQPTGHQPPDDGGIVDDHHARAVRGSRVQGNGGRRAHQRSLAVRSIASEKGSEEKSLAVRRARLPGTWPS